MLPADEIRSTLEGRLRSDGSLSEEEVAKLLAVFETQGKGTFPMCCIRGFLKTTV